MTVLVLDGHVGDALARLGPDEWLIVVEPSAERLERAERAFADPRLAFLIGDGSVIPVPDRWVDVLVGKADEEERRRVLRR